MHYLHVRTHMIWFFDVFERRLCPNRMLENNIRAILFRQYLNHLLDLIVKFESECHSPQCVNA